MKQKCAQGNTGYASENAQDQTLGQQLCNQTAAASAVLRAISLQRVAPLASARFATFAQAMSNTIRTAPNVR
jgi:hypothetical protein